MLSFDPVAMAQHEDSLVDTVIHEICHVINWRLAKLAEDLAGKNAFKQERVREAMEDVTTFAQHTVAHLARMAAQTPPPRRGG